MASLNSSKHLHIFLLQNTQPKGGRTRTDKIGVGTGGDIGGTDITCNLYGRQYTWPTRQSFQDDHRHVGVMPATPSINAPT
jgi:hypothetical protein